MLANFLLQLCKMAPAILEVQYVRIQEHRNHYKQLIKNKEVLKEAKL